MNYILYNNVFDILVGFFGILSIISSFIISTKELKNDLKTAKEEKTIKISKIKCFKIATIAIYTVLFSIIIVKIANKYNFSSYITIIYYTSLTVAVLKFFKRNINDLTTDNKITYAMISAIFLVFFSSKTTSIYINAFYNSSHTIKEFLLITFVSIKIIFFHFLFNN